MTKKKAAPAKQTRARAAAAANPVTTQDVAEPPKTPKAAEASSGAPLRPPFRRPQSLNFAGVGRNDICPCGSGKRFKNCHGR
ncbi:MAG TPA: SEC-C metal-binding domain-containing protein [Candidatus Dormibacteraeota bacterium]|jgi:preprotein translocase subunit SecA|nr:SEC-C metal-binding domain-containing protein [Candidatus Dormibacteraeota bacterium]